MHGEKVFQVTADDWLLGYCPLMMKAVSTSQTSVNFYQTRRNILEDNHLHTRRHENLKSHLFQVTVCFGGV
jgi:hypothetical protein